MPNNDAAFEAQFNAAKAAIQQLLDVLDIGRVICVDDMYANTWSVDDLVIAQAKLTETQLQNVLGRPEDTFPDDSLVRRQSFRQAWEAIAPEQRNAIAGRLSKLASRMAPEEPNDFGSSSALSDIIGDRLIPVAPSQWREQWQKLKDERLEKRTLLLFDQDLSRDGEASATNGLTLAKAALSDPDVGTKIMCGLLTHTATIESQNAEWITLAKSTGVDQDRFIVIAKGWLSRDPFGFARMLKLAALGPDCRAMKARVRELLHEATDDAAAEIEKIQVDDFDHMVFRASRNEGLWEPDMLFRLFGIFHRTAIRQKAYKDARLPGLSTRLRSVSHIPTDSDTAQPPGSWKVQRAEMYEPGDYLNSLHLPIEIGDMFQKTDAQSEKYYVLIGQPCDLMVRSDGKRYPESTDVILVEVVPADESKEYSVPLPYLSEDRSKKFFAMLRRAHVVHPCVLDLCVLNADGTARINVQDQPANNLLPSWNARWSYLKAYADKLIRRYENFGVDKVDKKALSFIKTEAPKQFPILTSNSGLFKASVKAEANERSMTFNCKRVLRLHRPRAAALALKYAECFSRPAFDRDLGEETR